MVFFFLKLNLQEFLEIHHLFLSSLILFSLDITLQVKFKLLKKTVHQYKIFALGYEINFNIFSQYVMR